MFFRQTSNVDSCVMQPSVERRRLPLWAVTLVLAGVAVAVTGDAWADLWRIAWNDEEASHVLLAPGMALWLLWLRKHRLAGWDAAGRWPGTLLVGLGGVLWAVGYRYQYQVFWHGGAVVMLLGTVLVGFGQRVLVRFLPVVGAAAFLIPVPSIVRQWIALPLQQVTAQATAAVLEVLGYGVERSGNVLTMNGRDVAIVEACNGMRLVFTLLMGCYLFAFVMPLRGWVRIGILLLSPVVAVIANVVRLVPTVWIFGNASAKTAEQFHDVSGWVMIVVSFLGLMAIVRVLDWAMLPVMRDSAGTDSEGERGTA